MKSLKVFLIPLSLCFFWAAAAQAGPIDFETLPLSYAGTATTIPYGIRLTDTTDPNVNDPYSLSPAGAVWSAERVSVASGFSTTFWFRMSDGTGVPDPGDPSGEYPGADGFAFMIQNGGWESAVGNQALGVGAGGMGYMYISNSLAVEFDTWQNVPYGDLDGNHIAVNTRGTSFNMPHHTYEAMNNEHGIWPTDYTADPALYYQPVSRPLNDGFIQKARIDYDPLAGLSVYLNSTLLFTTPLNLNGLLDLTDDEYAYVGFTSGTRHGYQNHDILFVPIPEPATWLTLLGGLALVFAFSRARRGRGWSR
ncbi:MAG: hypothetical protein JW793_07165 [Acidobacteria bacterium]|nr:hypothetical protein [Acidobacteriota bacterium]